MRRKHADDAGHGKLGGPAGETVEAIRHLADSTAAKKSEKAADKEDKKAVKQAKKAARKGAPGEQIVVSAKAGGSKFTPKKARNAIGIAKVVAPAVIPILAPYAVRAAGAAREAWDRRQARRIGVGVDQLGEFTGRGAALHARIAGLSDGLADLRKSARASAEDVKFVERGRPTLEQLAATVRAAERMPAARRKAAHRAVAGELDLLESQLLLRLGV